uniref:CUB domain-containing protein n=1 Tax=Macrostomum lignano TaxID=282301 RepID=A0A1I8FBS6_9PLAT
IYCAHSQRLIDKFDTGLEADSAEFCPASVGSQTPRFLACGMLSYDEPAGCTCWRSKTKPPLGATRRAMMYSRDSAFGGSVLDLSWAGDATGDSPRCGLPNADGSLAMYSVVGLQDLTVTGLPQLLPGLRMGT